MKTINKIATLASFLNCQELELSLEVHGCYGLEVYSLGNQEYAIGFNDEADDAVSDAIKDSLWAFNASFILSECDLPLELEDGIKAMQEKQCENCNDAILALIKKTCGLQSFVDSAISADGRGHFLSGYDSNENEANELYIYRLN